MFEKRILGDHGSFHVSSAWHCLGPVPLVSAQQSIILLGEGYPSGEKTKWVRPAVVAERFGQDIVKTWRAIRLRQSEIRDVVS